MLTRLLARITGPLLALLSAVGAGLLLGLRLSARSRKIDRLETELEDFEHAEDIEDRVSRARADPERLRKYDDAGYRD